MAGKIVYGLNALREALLAPETINRVYFARDAKIRDRETWITALREVKAPFDFVPLSKLNSMTGATDHQGVAVAISPVAYAQLDDCLADCPPQALFLVLDQVQHPKNLGMIVRSAVGAGAQGILFPERGNALLDEEVVRASAGTVQRIPLIPCGNLSQAIKRLKKADFWVYAMEADAPQSVFTLDWPARAALVVGNESKGLRPGTRKNCDDGVSIPLAKQLESLNVAVAASVALFQYRATQLTRDS